MSLKVPALATSFMMWGSAVIPSSFLVIRYSVFLSALKLLDFFLGCSGYFGAPSGCSLLAVPLGLSVGFLRCLASASRGVSFSLFRNIF